MSDKIITFLNGEKEKQSVINQLAGNDDYYYNYLNPTRVLSSSCTKEMVQKPRLFEAMRKHPDKFKKDTSALIDGNILHCMILEPEVFNEKYLVFDEQKVFDYVDEKSDKEVKSYRSTKLYKDRVAEIEQEAGERAIMSVDHYDELSYVADTVLQNEECRQYVIDGAPEVPMIDTIGDYPYRAKADKLHPNLILDLKTTRFDSMHQAMNDARYRYNWDVQAYIYTQLFGIDDIKFLVVSKGAHNVFLLDVSHEFIDSGKFKLEEALSNYERFFAPGHFEDVNDHLFRSTL